MPSQAWLLWQRFSTRKWNCSFLGICRITWWVVSKPCWSPSASEEGGGYLTKVVAYTVRAPLRPLKTKDASNTYHVEDNLERTACVLWPHWDNDVKKLISVNQKRGEGYPFNSFQISLAFNCNFKCYSILLILLYTKIQLSLAAGCLSGPFKNCLVRESVRGSPVRLLWWGGIRLLRSVA